MTDVVLGIVALLSFLVVLLDLHKPRADGKRTELDEQIDRQW